MKYLITLFTAVAFTVGLNSTWAADCTGPAVGPSTGTTSEGVFTAYPSNYKPCDPEYKFDSAATELVPGIPAPGYCEIWTWNNVASADGTQLG